MTPLLQRETLAEVLELPPYPTVQQVKDNYRRLMKKYHPDVNKTPEALEYAKRLNKCYKLALDIAERQEAMPPPPPRGQRVKIIIEMNGTKMEMYVDGIDGRL